MTSPFSDELISAYLDGELTAQERANVEAKLRENAELRRMCDELRLLRVTLQALPAAEPPDNFTERILRQAERRMLSDEIMRTDTSDAPDAPEGVEAAKGDPAPAKRPRFTLRNWPVAVAAVAALAACALAMLALPPMTQSVRDVARAPDTQMAEPQAAQHGVEYLAETDRSENGASAALTVDPFVPRQESAAPPTGADLARRAMSTPSAAPATAPVPPAPPAFPKSVAAGRPEDEGLQRSAPMGQAMDSTMDNVSGRLMQRGAAGVDSLRQKTAEADSSRDSYGTYGGMPGGGQSGFSRNSQAGGFAGGGSGGEIAGAEAAGMGSQPTRGRDAARSLGPGFRFENQPTTGVPVTIQEIDQLVTQLNQTQTLLVKLQISEQDLAPTLGELSKSASFDQPADEEGNKKRKSDAMVLSYALGLQTQRADAATSSHRSRAFFAEDSEAPQNVVVVDGSADQIRESLTRLIAKPSVAVETTPPELSHRWREQLTSLFDLKQDLNDGMSSDRSSGDGALYDGAPGTDGAAELATGGQEAKSELRKLEESPDQSAGLTEGAGERHDAAAGAEPAMAAKKPSATAEELLPSVETKADLADKPQEPDPAQPALGRQEMAENRTILYILFRLRSN
ncbi:MAG: anti-sigma factor family protein [Pirellulaceae bacterium]